MGQISYSNDNLEINGMFFFSNLNIANKISTIYDSNIDNSIVFVKSIRIEDSETNIQVCLTTINGETLCFDKTENELTLDQITRITLQTKPNPEPNNDDKSKDETSLWMFLTNNLWLLIIIGIVIIISVYVYMTFQERTEAYKTSILGNGMLYKIISINVKNQKYLLL